MPNLNNTFLSKHGLKLGPFKSKIYSIASKLYLNSVSQLGEILDGLQVYPKENWVLFLELDFLKSSWVHVFQIVVTASE